MTTNSLLNLLHQVEIINSSPINHRTLGIEAISNKKIVYRNVLYAFVPLLIKANNSTISQIEDIFNKTTYYNTISKKISYEMFYVLLFQNAKLKNCPELTKRSTAELLFTLCLFL